MGSCCSLLTTLNTFPTDQVFPLISGMTGGVSSGISKSICHYIIRLSTDLCLNTLKSVPPEMSPDLNNQLDYLILVSFPHDTFTTSDGNTYALFYPQRRDTHQLWFFCYGRSGSHSKISVFWVLLPATPSHSLHLECKEPLTCLGHRVLQLPSVAQIWEDNEAFFYLP